MEWPKMNLGTAKELLKVGDIRLPVVEHFGASYNFGNS